MVVSLVGGVCCCNGLPIILFFFFSRGAGRGIAYMSHACLSQDGNPTIAPRSVASIRMGTVAFPVGYHVRMSTLEQVNMYNPCMQLPIFPPEKNHSALGFPCFPCSRFSQNVWSVDHLKVHASRVKLPMMLQLDMRGLQCTLTNMTRWREGGGPRREKYLGT